MKIGFISTRLAGTDGVSLETHKWADVACRLGHEVYYCAGELEEDGDGPQPTLIPELHFRDPEAEAIGRMIFGRLEPPDGLSRRLEKATERIAAQLRGWLRKTGLDVMVVENALAIPMHVPLGLALARVIKETEIPTIGHHHDFYWERQRFRLNCIPEMLRKTFPPDLPSIRHVVINSLAQRDLKFFRGLDARLVPNVFDYATPAPGIDEYNQDFRKAMGFSAYDWLFLQPTRVVARKGIDISFELLRRLREPRARLVISHQAGDEGMAYYRQLLDRAEAMNVEVHYLAGFIEEQRVKRNGRKSYTLWDVYPHADFVTYPSLYEGFGNALLEAIYFRKPVLINRYSVYVADIAPLGFDFVEVDGWITDEVVAQVRRFLDDPGRCQAAVDRNYELARQHFSHEVLADALKRLLSD
ncbi:MAG: glycosyltransferase family 4 protein [Anaerolineae bacterium]|jgi:glycosyltransferase involved in cell wall biosynthesis